MTVYGLAVYICDYGIYDVMSQMSPIDYSVLVLGAILSIWNMLIRAKVLTLENANKSAQYSYLSPVF